ncbi:ATP-dependent DNA ligase LigB [Mycobacterium tuberculosis M2140]|nr:ATP-dependent DNA ligase LigB [Mycobacterium tuberculosis M2140]
MDVAATSSRLTKVARIAALLHRAAPDTQLVTIIVSWLSGELPQRHIGVGWAALRSLPPPAPQPALTVTGVDATLSKIGTLSGKGSQAQRAALVAELFSAATLSIVFVVVVVLVVVAGVIVALKTIRGRGIPLAEDDPAPSTLFAPAGLIPTAAERKLQRRLGAPASASVAAPD